MRPGTWRAEAMAIGLFIILSAATTTGQVPGIVERPEPRSPHLRSADSTAAALLAEGRRRSGTFLGLAEAVEMADVLVFVESRAGLRSAGSVVFGGTAGSTRILRVRIRTPGCTNALVAVLGHELHHVLEIAELPELRSEDAIAEHYERVGLRMAIGDPDVRVYETMEARHVGALIRHELLGRGGRLARR